MKNFLRKHLDLQAKISLVLVAVILPTFLIVTLAENKIILPILEEEIRQVGLNAGKRLATELATSKWLSLPNPTPLVEDAIQELVYAQPDIIRMDVVAKELTSGRVKPIASNIEEDPSAPPVTFPLVESVTSEFRLDEAGVGQWEIFVPIEHRSRDQKSFKKLLGTIHVLVSTKAVSRVVGTLSKVTAGAALFSVVSLIFVLRYFLRKTISNDRLLKQTESENLQLLSQLQETQRQLLNNEKLAVMGQLTASFAHEIGTPLNAVGGHLQLLKEEVSSALSPEVEARFEIVNGQLSKIEKIVKNFLQSTAKPVSQKQLVDLNQIVDQTLRIILPRVESLGLQVSKQYDQNMGPVRVVPLDVEQVLLNLLNNSLDSLKSKSVFRDQSRLQLKLISKVCKDRGRAWAQITVFDTGEGISKSNIRNVLKPFFTTKPPGDGTGLGLPICQQIVEKYGGDMVIDSKEGAWTAVTLRLPYHAQGLS